MCQTRSGNQTFDTLSVTHSTQSSRLFCLDAEISGVDYLSDLLVLPWNFSQVLKCEVLD